SIGGGAAHKPRAATVGVQGLAGAGERQEGSGLSGGAAAIAGTACVDRALPRGRPAGPGFSAAVAGVAACGVPGGTARPPPPGTADAGGTACTAGEASGSTASARSAAARACVSDREVLSARGAVAGAGVGTWRSIVSTAGAGASTTPPLLGVPLGAGASK